MGQINTNNYPAVDSLLDADLLIVENATHGTGTTTPKQLRENAIGTNPLQTTAQTVTGAINEIFEMATDTVVGLELGKMTSFSDGTIVTDIDLHRAPVAGDRILFYHGTSVASPSSLTTYNDGVAVTTTIGDFSLTHPAGLTLMKCVALGESLRWQTVQDIASGYTAGTGISINGTTINNTAPQLGDDIAYSRVDTVTSGALGYFSADADCLVMDFRTNAEPYNGGYTLRLTTTGASFKYATLKDKAGNDYSAEIPSGSLVLCKSNVSGTGSEADPVVVTVLEIGNVEMAHDVEVLKDICITEKTVSGNPITVTDALPYPAVSLSAEIEASQDLHGLPFPYVGGAYKNKLPMTVDGIKALNTEGTWSGNEYTIHDAKFTLLTDSANNFISISANGITSANHVILKLSQLILPGGIGYTLTGCPSGGSFNGYRLSNFRSNTVDVNDIGSGGTITVSNDESYTFMIYVKNSGTVLSDITFYPMLRLSTVTDPTFAPWENKCPISGRDSVAVDDTGKNQLSTPYSLEDRNNVYYTLNTDGRFTLNGTSNGTYYAYIKNLSNPAVLPVGTYTFSIRKDGVLGTGNLSARVRRYNHGVADDFNDFILNNGVVNVPIVNADDVCAFFASANSGVNCNGTYFPQIEEGTSASAFVPYAHSSATIQLGTTVYGADINWDTGVMTVKTAKQTLNSDLTWVRGGGGSIPTGRAVYYFTEGLTGAKPCGNDDNSNNITMKSNIYNIANKSYNAMRLETGFALGIGGDSNSSTIGCNVSSVDIPDASAFETWLDSNPIEIEYPLATPTTIQLTPAQLTMLKGYNRLSCDGGGDITLTYKADRLAAIEAALAELQN